MEIFWSTIARYNAATWRWQIVIVAAAVLLTLMLYRHPGKRVEQAMKLFLALLNVWIALVYYLVYGYERSYSNVMVLFWALMAVLWLYDLFAGATHFKRTRRPGLLSMLLYLMPMIYPLFSLMRGLTFPMMTMPVMPCSVVVFTLGLMVAFTERINLFAVLYLGHWAFIGLAKVYFFGIPEDYLLAVSTIPALYLFFREYVRSDTNRNRKPDARVFNLLLTVICLVVGAFFMATLLPYLHPDLW